MSGWEGGLSVAEGAGAVSCLGQGRRLVLSGKEMGMVFRGKKGKFLHDSNKIHCR